MSLKLLIVTATKNEVLPLLQFLKKNFSFTKINRQNIQAKFKQHQIDILITGAGIHHTAFYLGKFSSSHFDFVINAGICGAFDKTLSIGEVVIIKEDVFSEFGAEDGNRFLKASEINLGSERVIPKNLHIPKVFKSLKQVKGITVNTVHGNSISIKKTLRMFQPQVESMETGAFYFACNQNKWKCVALRSVSNYVEKRNKDKWNIPLAIKNLNISLIQYLESI